jgi:Arabinose efflux permease
MAMPHAETARAWPEIVAGIRVTMNEPAVRLVLLVSGFGFVTIGALDVVTVVLAIDRLGGTASTAAWMTAAIGAGGVFGSAMGGWLIGRRLAPALALAAVEFGIALAVIGVVANEVLAFAMLFAAGIGQAIVAIAGHSILQRSAPAATIGRTFALREALYNLGLAAGSILASALISAFGIEVSLIVIGALLPAVTLLRLAAVWRLDAAATVPIVELSLLRATRIFGRLPGPALEGLARNAQRVTFAPGEYLMRQGEVGDRYLAIAVGEAEVVEDGVPVATCSPGDGVGEIALLREVPRTASVRARSNVEALTDRRRSARQRQDLGSVVSHCDRVLEMSGPAAVDGDDRPTVVQGLGFW